MARNQDASTSLLHHYLERMRGDNRVRRIGSYNGGFEFYLCYRSRWCTVWWLYQDCLQDSQI